MTLLEIVEEEEKEDLQPVQVVQWLAEMVQKAVEEGRLACGLEGCVNVLGSGPDEVMLCVLPGSSAKANVDVMIQHTLIKAFCVEHYIHVLSVDCATKLTKLIYHSYQQAAQMGKADVTMPPVPENSPCPHKAFGRIWFQITVYPNVMTETVSAPAGLIARCGSCIAP